MSSLRDRLKSGLPRLAVVAHDLAMVWLVWQALHKLRFGVIAQPPPLPLWSTEIALVLAAQGLVFWQVGLYRGLWRFAGVPDLWNIFKACMLGLFAIVLGLFLYNRVDQVPRTVLVLYPLVLMGMLGAPRLLYRAWKDSRIDSANAVSVRILILGAGRALSLIHI